MQATLKQPFACHQPVPPQPGPVSPLFAVCAACMALAGPALGNMPASITLNNLEQTYDGLPKEPLVTTDPPGLEVSLRYTDPAEPPPAPVVETIYQRAPATLALSYPSLAFKAHSAWAFGDLVEFGGEARELKSVDVVMVTWAKAADYPDYAAADPGGWYHPLTLKVFARDSTTGRLSEIAAVTRTVWVPWRPLNLPDGRPYTLNGHAFWASFQFPAGIVLPPQAMFMVASSSQHTGFEPFSARGPYNELNIAVGSSPSVGTDVSPGNILMVKSETQWIYPQAADDLRFVVKASRVPETGTTTPPVNAGVWQVSAVVTTPGYAGSASAMFTIAPAPLGIRLEQLLQTADGMPKVPVVVTEPTDVPVALTYDGTTNPPSQPGRYQVMATSGDPNYQGSAREELRLVLTYDGWAEGLVNNGNLPPSASGPMDDPEGDGLVNLMEYTMGTDPAATDGNGAAGLRIEFGENGYQLAYTRNRHAADIEYIVESALNPAGQWDPVDAMAVLIVPLIADLETVRIQAPAYPEDRRFFRLRVVRQVSES